MRIAFGLLSIFMLASVASSQEQPAPGQPPLVRKSITVELQREGKKEPYIEHFENVPFVENNSVYLFPGDNFGVDLTVADRKVVVAYDPRPKKADLEFSLVQQTASNTKRPFMILHVENRLARIVGFSVVMKLPEQK